jgi:hypothetical protein
VAYVLLSKEFDEDNGVYRLNSYSDGSSLGLVKDPIFSIGNFTGKVSGLSVNQENEIFLLSSKGSSGNWQDAEVGWKPTGMTFDEDSPIYLKILPTSDYPTMEAVHGLGSHWYRNKSLKNKTYKHVIDVNGPDDIKYLFGASSSDKTRGTPMWDGSAGIPHPTKSDHWILPSHWAGAAYYLYGSNNNTEFVGEPLDGTVGNNGNIKPTYIYGDLTSNRGTAAGHTYGITITSAGSWKQEIAFNAIVKRVYKHRTKTLDLYSAFDYNPVQGPNLKTAGVLATKDISVTESYGKACGDNCLPGGLLDSSSVLTKLTEVYVFTSTRGNRYGFNPLGEKQAPYGGNADQAALRVVFKGSSNTVPYPLLKSANEYSDFITNKTYLQANSIQPSEIKVLGVSSKFSSSTGLDHIYASKADKFTVQDSWWGRGGIAYEYYKDTGAIYKLDFVENTSPTPEAVGILSGEVEDIAIDGEGYLYVMRNEKSPSDTTMMGAIVSAGNPSANPYYIKTSSWLRKTTGGDGSEGDPIEIPDGSELPGDYKEVTLRQAIQKVVKRYAPATGGLGTEENWGEVEAGYDYWTKRLEKKANGSIGWVSAGSWEQEPEADRNSLIQGELAVVNIAKIPEEYTPTDPKPHIVRLSGNVGAPGSAPVADQSSVEEGKKLSFKIEGYKPYINGTKYGFKNIGDVRNPDNNALVYKNLSLNLIPAEDGTYNHDEDGDGNSSGFPSSMFESTNHPTTITWKLDWVEENPSNTLLENIPLTSDVATIGADGQVTITFPHPGNYLLYANINYNKFDYSNLQATSDARPHKLTASPASTETYKYLIKVYSTTLSLNQTKNFISNITLTPNDRLYQGNIKPDTQNINSSSNYDLKEDEEITALEFSFTGQFVRDANIHSNQTAALDTYNGIGVWDYNYYKTLYNDISNVFAGMDYSISDTYQGHVYNHVNGTDKDIMSNVNLSVYNPGWKKAGDTALPGKHSYGTSVKESINNKDLRFIQWAIYLRPTTPPNINPPTVPQRDSVVPRGIKIAQGHCAETGQFPDGTPYVQKDWSLGDRKCRFTIKMPMGRVEKIMTPIDPEAYTMHLEIIYPRVCWHNSDLGDGSGEKRFSSMIPYQEPTNGQAKPIHIISQIKVTDNGNNYLANQSYKTDSDAYIFANKDYWNVLVRDANIPQISESMTNEIIQTTNDLVATVTVKFAVADNNPMAEIGTFKIAYENVNTNRPADTSDSNKPFEFLGTIPESGITRFKGPESTNYFSDNSWQQAATFTQEIEPYGPGKAFDQGNALVNWVGQLNYTAFGEIKDGLGTDSKNLTHVCYHPDAWNDVYGPSAPALPSEGGIVMFSKALTRIDNDPPTLEVELVSQIDNRRWVFKLEENEQDTAPRGTIPSSITQLGVCKLSAKTYNLQTGNELADYNADVEGCTAYPSDIGTCEVNSQTILGDASIPAFRRSSRLLVNVKATDNVAYKAFQDISIAITDLTDGGNRNMLPSNSNAISTVSSIDSSGADNSQLDDPRARFAIDMPMKVVTGTNQVKIVFSAQDQQGNKREITIPVRILDNTFNTRVLENKENRN